MFGPSEVLKWPGTEEKGLFGMEVRAGVRAALPFKGYHA